MKRLNGICIGLSIAVALASTTAFAAVTAGPNDFALSCAVWDADTRLPKSVFQPGESMLLRGLVKAGDNVISRRAHAEASATFKALGIGIDSNLGKTTLNFPSEAERQQIADWDKYQDDVPSNYAAFAQYRVSIPTDLPQMTVTVRVTVAFEGVGEKTCSRKIEVQ